MVEKNTAFTIRQAREEDIPALARFEAEISAVAFGEEAITDPSFHATKLRKAMEKDASGMFVLEIDCTVNGWLWMDMKTNFITKETYANFRSFYTTEECCCGEALLNRGMDYCRERGAGSVVGKVHTGNLPMRSLYKNAGFTATHITMEYRFL
jgi:L-amino acid N-acyltransferase YncA